MERKTIFTARRVGPLDLELLREQNTALSELRDYLAGEVKPQPWIDAVDGMVHLSSTLLDSWEYLVQGLGDPPAELADAWDRYQQGGAGAVTATEDRKLNDWRRERAEEAGF